MANPKLYCFYVHGYLLPYLEQLRADGKLTTGKNTFSILILKIVKKEISLDGEGGWVYEGEVDENGRMCGDGLLQGGPFKLKLFSTFLKGQLHGIRK